MNSIDSVLKLDKSSRSEAYFNTVKNYLTFDNPKALYLKAMNVALPDDMEEVLHMYSETKTHYVFPRALLYHLITEGTPDVKFACKSDDVVNSFAYGNRTFNYEINFEPRAGQLAAVEGVLKRFSRPTCLGGILHASTGTGKSVMSTVIALEKGKPTLIVTHRKHLHQNFRKAIELVCPEATVGFFGGKSTDNGDTHDFVLTTVQTLVSKRSELTKEFKDSFGMLILDETHVFGAPGEWVKVLQMFRSRYRLGLTATLKRRDGLETVYQAHIGPVLHSISKPPMLADVFMQEHKHSAPYKLKRYPKALREDYNVILGRVYEDHAYLNKVAKQIIDAAASGRKVIVMGRRKNTLNRLREKVTAKGVDSQIYTGADTFDMIDQDNLSIIFTTDSKSGAGFDIEALDCIIFPEPMKDVTQLVGRVLRPLEGKPTPIVVDNYYVNSKMGYNQAVSREAFYRRAGHNVRRSIRV